MGEQSLELAHTIDGSSETNEENGSNDNKNNNKPIQPHIIGKKRAIASNVLMNKSFFSSGRSRVFLKLWRAHCDRGLAERRRDDFQM